MSGSGGHWMVLSRMGDMIWLKFFYQLHWSIIYIGCVIYICESWAYVWGWVRRWDHLDTKIQSKVELWVPPTRRGWEKEEGAQEGWEEEPVAGKGTRESRSAVVRTISSDNMEPTGGLGKSDLHDEEKKCGQLTQAMRPQLRFTGFSAFLNNLYKLYFDGINPELCPVCQTDCFWCLFCLSTFRITPGDKHFYLLVPTDSFPLPSFPLLLNLERSYLFLCFLLYNLLNRNERKYILF